MRNYQILFLLLFIFLVSFPGFSQKKPVVTGNTKETAFNVFDPELIINDDTVSHHRIEEEIVVFADEMPIN